MIGNGFLMPDKATKQIVASIDFSIHPILLYTLHRYKIDFSNFIDKVIINHKNIRIEDTVLYSIVLK
jgi:hypothetical protein